jgi:hypothetical protein
LTSRFNGDVMGTLIKLAEEEFKSNRWIWIIPSWNF